MKKPIDIRWISRHLIKTYFLASKLIAELDERQYYSVITSIVRPEIFRKRERSRKEEAKNGYLVVFF